MNLNREKLAFAASLLLFVGGIYGVVVAFVSPAREVRIPTTDLPKVQPEFFAPKFRSYALDESGGATRNPFSFSEGWQRLDSMPLDTPPVSNRIRVLPLLAASAPAADGGLLYEIKVPRETESSKTQAEKNAKKAAAGGDDS